jgi:hypothetical protein
MFSCPIIGRGGGGWQPALRVAAQGVFIQTVSRQPWLHFSANLREWERQPFFLTLIAEKWLPRPQLLSRKGFCRSRCLGFLAISVKNPRQHLIRGDSREI